MKKMIMISTMLLFFVACETGVGNKGKSQVVGSEPVLSGIVDKGDVPKKEHASVIQKTTRHTAFRNTTVGVSKGRGFKKIFSRSAQPGFYLQMAVFAKHRPNKHFLRPLDRSPFNYIVLNQSNKDYVLIGPYKSYKEAKSKVRSVKSRLKKQTFVVQVLRP